MATRGWIPRHSSLPSACHFGDVDEATLSLEGHLIQPTLAMIEAGPVHEEPSLAVLPPTTDDPKEVWDRSTSLPLDPKMAKKARREEKDFMPQLGVAILSSLEE